jgi:hypothetical protein
VAWARLSAAVRLPGRHKNGTLQYMGGIDSLATSDAADIARAEPYLKEAMLAVVQGNPVAHPATKPYGCSVKY